MVDSTVSTRGKEVRPEATSFLLRGSGFQGLRFKGFGVQGFRAAGFKV